MKPFLYRRGIVRLSRLSLCLLFIGAGAGLGNATGATSRPNLVVILCDDLGYGDLGCYGHPHIKTPNLDRMANDGVRFTACYSAAPVCSPSRIGLLTGRSPNRAGVYDWIPPDRGPREDARDQVHLRQSEITIPQLLKQAGYATCMAGKWHCNSKFNQPEQPQPGDFGFDHWMATQNNARPSHEKPDNYVRNGQPAGRLEGYSCQLAADEALNWLEGHLKAEPDQPFFIFLPFHEPHEPVASPPELVAKYLPIAKNENQAQYFANVENVDRAVGRVLAKLEELGQAKNTLVVFTSDNGPETLDRYRGANRSYGSPGPLKGMKLWTAEAGFRVPGIMHWPGTIESGQVSRELISSLDFLPTFCALAGIVIPDGLKLDGANFLPALSGERIQRERPLLWCYYNAINEHRVAMRDGDWKILAKLNGGELPKHSNLHSANAQAVRSARLTDFEIYRLADDIGEASDLSAAHPDKRDELVDKLRAAYRELVDDSQAWNPAD